MEISSRILSDIIVFSKYSRFLPAENRKETWNEIVDRNKKMHLKKYPHLKDEIEEAYKLVYDKKVLPSMRSLQFAGKAIEVFNSRINNCAYLPIDASEAFQEIMFLLLGGSGVGFSVQYHHINKLPPIILPKKEKRFIIQDSIIGWSDAVKVLMKSYFTGHPRPRFDFSDIREKGTPLKTSGGIAPGPEPLKDCLHNIQKVLDRKSTGDKLTSLECHDICCYIADCVLAGGIRRAATISLFSFDDEEMLAAKAGKWYELNPQRGRANNSAVILRHKIKKKEFLDFWEKIKASGSGEPGYLLSNDQGVGTNPCLPSFALVLTPSGIRELEQVTVGDKIWSNEGWTTIVDKWSTGIKPVYRYTTTAGYFDSTENHSIQSNGKKIEVGKAKSVDLCYGPNPAIKTLDPQAIIDGLVVGDGSRHMLSKEKIYLTIGQNDSDYFTSEIKDLITEPHAVRYENAWKVKTTISVQDIPETFERKIPSKYFYGNATQVASFLRGLYSANGSVCGNRVTLKATSLWIIKSVQIMLSSLGIRSYYTTNKPSTINWNNGTYTSKKSYDLNISADREKFASTIGFLQKYKTEKLQKIIESLENVVKKPKNSFDIIENTNLGYYEVFDITVDNNSHTFWCQNFQTFNCGEVALKPFSFCNLSEINVADITDQEDLNTRAKVAAFIGTLQAGYTDFHYLREEWRTNTEKDALIGVGMTGIATGRVLKLNINEAADIVKQENVRVAKLIGINKAARCTVVKPAGTSSIVLGCSSGIHAWHSKYYIRRIRVNKEEPLYKYLLKTNPFILEDDFFKPTTDAVISVPQKAPVTAITREESAIELLDRVGKIYEEWILPGHRSGHNTNNVSATISIKGNEWEEVGEWMWKNKERYTALSVLPHKEHSYVQAPFSEITKEQYESLLEGLKDIDLTKLTETGNSNMTAEPSCAGGACEISYV